MASGVEYVSSRNGVDTVSFRHTVYNNVAPDGGLFLPKQIHTLSAADVEKLAVLSFPELFYEIVSLFISAQEVPPSFLRDVVRKAFQDGNHFACDNVVNVVAMEPPSSNIHIAELFHGNSWTFKDVAMTFTGRLLEYFHERVRTRQNIMVVTSGDTGSAAIEAMRGLDMMELYVLFPDGQCSDIQVKQMTSAQCDNIHVYSCGQDMCFMDIAMEKLMADPHLQGEHSLMTMNSQNWARVLGQIPQYFYSYFQTCTSVGQPVRFHVPTGGFGNITAGLVAKLMGLPIHLVAACNQNGVAERMIRDGKLEFTKDVLHSMSCAIDIVFPVNAERILYYASGGQTSFMTPLMESLRKGNEERLPGDVLAKMQEWLSPATVTEDCVLATISRCYEHHNYAADPHTAIGLATALDRDSFGLSHLPPCPAVCVATASPEKFPEAMQRAGVHYPESDRVRRLKLRTSNSTAVPRSVDLVTFFKTEIANWRQRWASSRPSD